MNLLAYDQLLRAKAAVAPPTDVQLGPAEINTILKQHQHATVQWAVDSGLRALFAASGLGKPVMQIET